MAAARRLRNSPAVTKVLPMPVPVPVIKMALIITVLSDASGDVELGRGRGCARGSGAIRGLGLNRMIASMDSIRHDWTREEMARLYALPFADLLFEAQSVHRKTFSPNEVQISTLLSIKTGGCPEDCGYCSQSAYHKSGLKAE